MVDGYYTAVAKALRASGFQYSTQAKGSHEKWMNAEGKTLVVPRSLMSRHTANAILRDAGSSIKLKVLPLLPHSCPIQQTWPSLRS